MAADETPKLVPTGDVRHVIELGIELQAEASAHAIHNVFDDGGYKELILLRLFELRKLDRVGDDATDAQGRRYEIKTVARIAASGERKPSLSVTTEHTLTRANLDRYRQTYLWIVAVFDQAHPEAIYEISPDALEPYFTKWEARLDVQHDSSQPAVPRFTSTTRRSHSASSSRTDCRCGRRRMSPSRRRLRKAWRWLSDSTRCDVMIRARRGGVPLATRAPPSLLMPATLVTEQYALADGTAAR